MGLILVMGLLASMAWGEENRLETDLSLRPIIAGIQSQEQDPFGIKEGIYPNNTLYSLSLESAQSRNKTKKNGRIIGTLIGAGIGGGVGYSLYSALVESQEGELKKGDKPSPLFIIVPTVVGGLSGYAMGTYQNGISRKEEFGLEQPKKISKKGRIIGTTIGIGIGGYFGYMIFVAVALTSLGEHPVEPSLLHIIVPSAIGGTLGYAIGKGYDIGNYYLKR